MTWSRESRHKRGYDSKWDKTRKRILDRDLEQCQCDQCKKRVVPLHATEVDHIISKKRAERMGWTKEQIDDDSNLQAINHDCHKRKTTEETGKTYRKPVTIGLDGWPVDGDWMRK